MNKNDQYLKALSARRFNRIVSWLCIVILLGLIIATLVTGITGSKYFMGFLALMIVVPIIFYVVLWIGRLLFCYGKSPIEFVEQEADTEATEGTEGTTGEEVTESTEEAESTEDADGTTDT